MRARFLLTALLLAGCDTSLGARPDGEVDRDGGTVLIPDGAAPDAGSDAGGAIGCFDDAISMGGAMRLTIDEAVAGGGCSTAVVRPLSEQLIGEIQCLAPGSMARIDDIGGLTLNSTALPWLQTPARDALASAVARGGGGLSVNSTLRTLPQQLMLYRWYQAGLCGITLAASPGTSPHESGMAIDTSEYTAWRSDLEASGWRWHGAGDLPHFDYVGGGAMDLEGLSVLAFQRLWNRNHPEDPIAEDGSYGPQTEGRLRRSPAEGFATGAMCDVPTRAPLTLDWALTGSAYTLTATADADVERVAFAVDGRPIGTATRSPMGTYALLAGTCADGMQHRIELVASGAGGETDRAVALLEAEAESAVFVRPRAPSTYEIGLERPAADVAAIEVSVDGTLLTDATTGTTRSTRRAVLYAFSTLGMRSFDVRSYGADGGLLETRTFSFGL